MAEGFSPFDFTKALTETKEYLFDEETSKEYRPFIINRALSFNLDCLYPVSEINQYKDIPPKAQHDFLLNILEKKRRYGRWVKKDSFPDDLELVKEVFGYSTQRAIQALGLMTEEQIAQLRETRNKGGRK